MTSLAITLKYLLGASLESVLMYLAYQGAITSLFSRLKAFPLQKKCPQVAG